MRFKRLQQPRGLIKKESTMNKRELKHALDEVEVQLSDTGYTLIPKEKMVNWAFQSLLVDELRQLNKNVERLTDYLKG